MADRNDVLGHEPERTEGAPARRGVSRRTLRLAVPAGWDNLLLGLRLGEAPRICVATTPKPTRLLKELIADPTTATTRGTTYDNRPHLAKRFYEKIIGRFEGTRLGQQELLAEILEIGEAHGSRRSTCRSM